MTTKSLTRLKKRRRLRRRRHIRRRLSGMPERPRLTVYRSLQHTYAQLVDDETGRTICAASTMEKALRQGGTGNVEAAQKVGRLLAERAKEKGIGRAVFDRNGYKFHGRVKAVAEAARAGGVEF